MSLITVEVDKNGSEMIKSLLFVNGTLQLVSALVAFNLLREEDDAERELYVCYCDVVGNGGEAYNIIKAMVRDDAKKTFCIGIKQLTKLRYSCKTSAKKIMKDYLDKLNYDEIYLGTLIHYQHRLLVNTYKNAKKICIGHGMGLVGESNKWFYSKHFVSIIRKVLCDFSDVHHIFDRQILILPSYLSDASVKSVPLTVPSKKLVLSIIRKCSENIIIPTIELTNNTKYCLLLPMNLSQAGWMTSENELSLYKEILDSIPEEYVIVIKAHPWTPQSFFCNQIFKNRTTVLLDAPEYAMIGIEFYEKLVTEASFIVSIFSSAFISLFYLYNPDIKHLFNQCQIDKYFSFKTKDTASALFKNFETVFQNLKSWDGKSWLN